MYEDKEIVTVRGETFYEVCKGMMRPTPETEQKRAERRKYLKGIASDIIEVLGVAKVTYGEAGKVLKMCEDKINYMSTHSFVSSGSDNSGE